MTIKFAARGVSTQFRTAQELVQTDGVTLKPTNGGEVLVYSSEGVQLATAYDSTTGGCKVGETTYADTSALNAAGFYVISDAHTAWDLSSTTPSKCGAGEVDVWEDPILLCYLEGGGDESTNVTIDFRTNVKLYRCDNNEPIYPDSNPTKIYTIEEVGKWNTSTNSLVYSQPNDRLRLKRPDGVGTAMNVFNPYYAGVDFSYSRIKIKESSKRELKLYFTSDKSSTTLDTYTYPLYYEDGTKAKTFEAGDVSSIARIVDANGNEYAVSEVIPELSIYIGIGGDSNAYWYRQSSKSYVAWYVNHIIIPADRNTSQNWNLN